MNSFRSPDAVSKVGSNLETFKDMDKVCSKVVLFLMIGNSRDSVKLGSLSKWLMKAVLIVKYIVNFEFVSWHAA